MAPTPHIDGCVGAFFWDDSWWLVVVDWQDRQTRRSAVFCVLHLRGIVGQEQLSQPLLLRVPCGIHVDLSPDFFNNAEDSPFGCDVHTTFHWRSLFLRGFGQNQRRLAYACPTSGDVAASAQFLSVVGTLVCDS